MNDDRQIEASRAALADHVPLFAAPRGDIAVSFEFFPPNTEAMNDTLWRSIDDQRPPRQLSEASHTH